MNLNVLVVEDNLSLNNSIVNMLKRESYEALGAVDIDSAKDLFVKHKPHIILLDVLLPRGYGYDLIPFFRTNHNCRMLMLTSLDDREIKKICYESGADDYITKPFDLHELLYKLNAIRRRILSELKEFQIGDIKFNIETNTLKCNDKEVIIQPSQARLLKKLYDKHIENSYVDKHEVFDWASDDVNETSRLQTLVARLRKNIDYVGSKVMSIETIYNKGYKLTIKR